MEDIKLWNVDDLKDDFYVHENYNIKLSADIGSINQYNTIKIIIENEYS